MMKHPESTESKEMNAVTTILAGVEKSFGMLDWREGTD